MDPLEQLQDIHLPTAVSAWPLSWAWWLSLGLLLCAIAISIWTVTAWLKRTHITRLALKELKALQQQGVEITVLQQFLKRVALSCFPRHEVAALHGDAWYLWLDKQANLTDKADNFSHNISHWQQGLYNAASIPQAQATDFALCQRWLKQSRLIAISDQVSSKVSSSNLASSNQQESQ